MNFDQYKLIVDFFLNGHACQLVAIRYDYDGFLSVYTTNFISTLLLLLLNIAAISTFTAISLPDDKFLVQSLFCYRYNLSGNISQCNFNFYTKDSYCNERYSVGLQCQGKYKLSANYTVC